MPQLYDIAILGANPGGYAAARYLAQRSCRVILLGGPHSPAECPLTDWVPRGGLTLSGLPKSLPKTCGAVAFREVCYHRPELKKRASFKSRAQAGFFVRYAELCDSLRAAASEAGATIQLTETPPSVDLQEDQVRISGQTEIAGRVLIITQGSPSQGLSDLSVPFRLRRPCSLSAAGLDVPISEEQSLSIRGSLHVLETPQRGDWAMFFSIADTLHVRLVSRSSEAEADLSELTDLIGRLQSAKILPENLRLDESRSAVWRPPGGVALELETHSAKRSLLASTAGGFADPITGQTIKPSIESSLLAAKVALSGLKAQDVQETLAKFEGAWREKLSDYLKSPNTSLHLLFPLLFANQSIVTRFTKALIHGEGV